MYNVRVRLDDDAWRVRVVELPDITFEVTPGSDPERIIEQARDRIAPYAMPGWWICVEPEV